jgi:hypothetical protein
MGELAGVLVALPPARTPQSRRGVYSLLNSLRSVQVYQAAVVLPISGLEVCDIDECLAEGVSDFVFVEDSLSALRALGVIGSSRLPTKPETRVRLWLTDECRGACQQHAVAWSSAFSFAVEVMAAPFPMHSTPRRATAEAAVAPSLARCEWLRNVITISGGGELLPCPAHRAAGTPAATLNSPIATLRTLGQWRESLGADELCRRCDRRARFSVEDWFGPRSVALPASEDAEPTLRDHVKRDASSCGQGELDRLLVAFAERVEQSSRARAQS